MHVLVTGANGHIGYNLCKDLIANGHQVRASVRSLADREKTAPLRALDGIELIALDLYQPEPLRAALAGVDVFFHLAAAYVHVVKRGREGDDVLRPSIEGAENAIRAAAAAKVPKVVLTSSVVSLPLTEPGASPVTEEDWTRDLRFPYIRAKVMAERRAWELAGELDVNLVTILPGAMCGPGFHRNTPSIDVIEGIMLGAMRMGVPNANFPYVDVRDVVSAHLLAAEHDCRGRFIVCNDRLPFFAEVIQTMRDIDSAVPRPLMTLPRLMEPAAPLFDTLNHRVLGSPRVMTRAFIGTIRGRVFDASNARIKRELGWRQAVSLETSLEDTMDAIKAKRARAEPAATRPTPP